MGKPKQLEKTTEHTHLEFDDSGKIIKLPHKEGLCGPRVKTEILEDGDRFIVRTTTKRLFDTDKVKEKSYPRDYTKWTKTTW